MKNRYVDFVTDEHLLTCIANLHFSYVNAKRNVTKKKFFSNKIDTIKLTFDSKFNAIDSQALIGSEILRQIDKSINNSIGTFHEQVLGGVRGYEIGDHSGYDIKSKDNTLFADIKNKHNTMNSNAAEAVFRRLARYADDHKKATCYCVQILAKSSFNTLWKADINGREFGHSRVRKISGDQFYDLVTGKRNSFYSLYKALPIAIEDYLKMFVAEQNDQPNSALEEIETASSTHKRSIIDQITHENFKYYLGFDDL